MSIWQKILAVQTAVKAVKKNGKNTFHKYDYATEQDVLAVKDLMNKNGLIAFPTLMGYETQQYGDKIQILQQIKYTVVDTETGESVESIVLGVGEDKGDKGAYKAATGANKYFYLKFFGVATGDDPERDEQPTPLKKAQQERAAQPIQASGAPSHVSLMRQIKAEMAKQGLNFTQVSLKSGVKDVHTVTDPHVLDQVLEVLKAG